MKVLIAIRNGARHLIKAFAFSCMVAIACFSQDSGAKKVKWKSVDFEPISMRFLMPKKGLKKKSGENGSVIYSSRHRNSLFWAVLSNDFDSSPAPYLLATAESAGAKCIGQKRPSIVFTRCAFVESETINHHFALILIGKRIVTLYTAGVDADLDTAKKFVTFSLPENLANESVSTFLQASQLEEMFPDNSLTTENQRSPGFFEEPMVVKLSVLFKANGQIGEIRILPFVDHGLAKYILTQRAIDAAKKIVFRPEIKNGRAIDVRKKIVYRFTLDEDDTRY